MGEKPEKNATVDKTPVSLLQEIFIPKGKPPSYELIYSEGVGESAIFRYSVSVGDISAVGEGKSKRNGKQAAALVMLKKLGRWRDGGGDSEGDTEGGSEGDRVSKATGEQGDNPIGDVNELCHAHKWPTPTFLLCAEVGRPHERVFTFRCIIQDRFCGTGSGQGKRLARREAAHSLLRQIRQLPVANAEHGESGREGAVAVQAEHELTFFGEEVTEAGQHRCLAQLCTIPVGVFYGEGQDLAAARIRATAASKEFVRICSILSL